jgi:hypothetical protein
MIRNTKMTQGRVMSRAIFKLVVILLFWMGLGDHVVIAICHDIMTQPAVFLAAAAGKDKAAKYQETVRQIYLEVRELGSYASEEFIRRDFFVGEDEDDTNKDTHVAILIQNWEGRERMTIRVTEMERSPSNPRVALAKRTRSVRYLVEKGRAEEDRSEFSQDELQELAPNILRAILNKKRLLKFNPGGNGRLS